MSRLRVPVGPEDHVLGPPDALVTLVEYGDFECPFCGRAYWEVKSLQRALGDQLRFVFRDFPLTQVHPHSMGAAEAAEAAGAQGRFWEMHAKLYENQRDLETPALLEYARELGLNLRRFAQDLEDRVHFPKIRRDFMGGVRSGVNGTPTFFVNGVRHEGPFTFDALLASIEEAPASEVSTQPAT
jgi:protein-disulfide isomerase